MPNDNPNTEVMKLLENATMAHEAGDFVNADRFYADFFDRALAVDPMAFYAIRLNNCLLAWGQLAKDFPGARISLQNKADESLAEFMANETTERFHDYVTIMRVLNEPQQGVDAFLNVYAEAPKRAQRIVKYVWNDLLIAKEWTVCSALLERPEQKLDELFAVFDQAAKMKDVDERFNTVEFDEHIVATLLNDVQRVVEVLRHAERSDEIIALARQFQQGVSQRQHAVLAKQVSAQGSYLFIGH